MVTVALVSRHRLPWRWNLEKKERRTRSRCDKIVPCDYRCSMATMAGYFAYGSETPALARVHVLRLEPNYI